MLNSMLKIFPFFVYVWIVQRIKPNVFYIEGVPYYRPCRGVFIKVQ